jgi:hypothetical protein
VQNWTPGHDMWESECRFYGAYSESCPDAFSSWERTLSTYLIGH